MDPWAGRQLSARPEDGPQPTTREAWGHYAGRIAAEQPAAAAAAARIPEHLERVPALGQLVDSARTRAIAARINPPGLPRIGETQSGAAGSALPSPGETHSGAARPADEAPPAQPQAPPLWEALRTHQASQAGIQTQGNEEIIFGP